MEIRVYEKKYDEPWKEYSNGDVSHLFKEWGCQSLVDFAARLFPYRWPQHGYQYKIEGNVGDLPQRVIIEW